jgi:ATP-binding cassette subfamily B protein
MRKSKNTVERFPGRSEMILWFLRGSVHFFVLSVIFSCVVSLADLIAPKIIQYTADSVIGSSPLNAPSVVCAFVDRIGGIAYLREHLGVVAAAAAVIAGVGAICRYLMMLFNSAGSERFVQRMRDQLYAHILRLPYRWHSENHTGDIIQRCTSDVETIKVFVSEQLTSLVRVLLLIGLSLYFMADISPVLALIEGAFIPLMAAGSIVFYSKIGRTFEKVDQEEGRLSDIAQENLTGVRVVRAFGREAFERSRFEEQNEQYTSLWYRLMRTLASFWVTGNVVATMRNLIVLLAGVSFAIHGRMTTGELIAFISYNALISLPVRSLGRVITEMSKAGISIDRLRYIMNAEKEDYTGTDPDRSGTSAQVMSGDICFEHVSFGFDADGGSGDGVLSDVTFTVPVGHTVGILGATGSGKSTILSLLDRLYDLPEGCGRITIGGKDIRTITLPVLRRNIGLVLQEPYLFSGTLEENIGITQENRKSADPEAVRRAARIACLDEAVNQFPKEYETYVGERGVTLSGGQKQRTAIAQMLIRRTPIMAFDDSLSAVDADTDRRIREALTEETAGATVLIVAHRITTLMQADEILVLQHGKIVQRGTHQQLLSKSGIYREIYELQTRDAI